jgi:hypothetical protein
MHRRQRSIVTTHCDHDHRLMTDRLWCHHQSAASRSVRNDRGQGTRLQWEEIRILLELVTSVSDGLHTAIQPRHMGEQRVTLTSEDLLKAGKAHSCQTLGFLMKSDQCMLRLSH